MKKLFANNKFTQKIFLSIIIVLLLSFAMPVHSQAGVGGILLDPVFDLIGTVFDVITGALQMFLVDGEMNNSKDGGVLNLFMVSKSDFEKNEDGIYNDWKAADDDKPTEIIQEDELDEGTLWSSEYYIPVLKYTPEKIFSGLIPALDINFVNPTDWEEEGYTKGEEMNKRSVAFKLHKTIASWYVDLRNLVVVGLMLILVYVGIRMVISSAASDKAKYKQMLMDWLVAICIVFCLHYIMTFTITIVNEISQAINGTSTDGNRNNIVVQVSTDKNDADNTEVIKFRTDLMGLMRFKMQYNNGWNKLIFLILYMAMVIYTCMFTFYYLKRVLTMAFLTLVSPLVALTYPIDKMKDGKAQAFDMWLKEYVFNALLQPFHLIIYTVFVGSAIELAANNPIYAIVTLAFITPAEKILRKFFGFEKASTAGTLGAAASIAGGAAAMNLAKGLMAPKKGGGGKDSGGKKPRQVEGNKPSIEDAYGGETGGQALEGGSSSDSSVRQAEQQDQTLSAGGESDSLPAVASTAGMHQSSSGLWVPDSSTAQTTPSSNSSAAGSSTSDQHGAHGFEWTDDDDRGLGRYALDVAKHGAGVVGGKIAGSSVGKGVSRVGKAISNKAGKAKNYLAGTRAVRTIENGAKAIRSFKPLANSAKGALNVAKGVGNVALQTGKAVGKAALKAAPGAMLGLAAGIAGDELSDIGKYTLAGAALSSTIGSSAVAQAGSFIANAYNTGAHGSVEGQVAQRRREFENSESNRMLAQSMYPDASKSEIKKMLHQASYYDSRGIEGKAAFKAAKVENDLIKSGISAERAQKQVAVAADYASQYEKKDLRDKQTVENLRVEISDRFKKSGLKGIERERVVEDIIKNVKSLKGVKNNY